MLSLLLDKNIVRRALNGLAGQRRGRQPDDMELEILTLLRLAQPPNGQLHTSPETANILRRLKARYLAEVLVFSALVSTMQPGRYFKRWARRLREYGFTREDPIILALGTFGYDPENSFFGVTAVVTLDQPLINNLEVHRDALLQRLASMTRQLAMPFYEATLPELWRPDEALTRVIYSGEEDDRG
jgi:hypothetical protein